MAPVVEYEIQDSRVVFFRAWCNNPNKLVHIAQCQLWKGHRYNLWAMFRLENHTNCFIFITIHIYFSFCVAVLAMQTVF